MTAAVATVAAMAYLTVVGALAGAPTEIDMKVAPQFQKGKDVMASSGCLSCHKVGDNGNTLGPNLTHVGDRLGKPAIERTLLNPTPPMPPYTKLLQTKPRSSTSLVNFVASSRLRTPSR